jgi:hypothetical protein
MKIRDSKGRFIKGVSASPMTQFKKGQHWRSKKPYWDKNWLFNEYINLGKSASIIALEQNCTENNILYFLSKHNIPIRSMHEIRKNKYWGLKGRTNGMHGRLGKDNPNWDGGHSPERQSLYARSAWKELAKAILKRDNYTCFKCGANSKLEVHHIKKWSRYPNLRFEPTNLITVCKKCHKKIHSRNTEIG